MLADPRRIATFVASNVAIGIILWQSGAWRTLEQKLRTLLLGRLASKEQDSTVSKEPTVSAEKEPAAASVENAGEASALLRLSYTSRMLTKDEDVAFRQIHEITEHANAENARLAVSGRLVFTEGSRAIEQTLEGPGAVVRKLFAKIEADSRHADVVVTEDILIAE
eukprot:4579704-Prymnesium_polylepis.1